MTQAQAVQLLEAIRPFLSDKGATLLQNTYLNAGEETRDVMREYTEVILAFFQERA